MYWKDLDLVLLETIDGAAHKSFIQTEGTFLAIRIATFLSLAPDALRTLRL